MCCAEVTDPVQQNFIVIKLGDIDIALSDFILPAWKDSQDKVGPFNYIKTPLWLFGRNSPSVISRIRTNAAESQKGP